MGNGRGHVHKFIQMGTAVPGLECDSPGEPDGGARTGQQVQPRPLRFTGTGALPFCGFANCFCLYFLYFDFTFYVLSLLFKLEECRYFYGSRCDAALRGGFLLSFHGDYVILSLLLHLRILRQVEGGGVMVDIATSLIVGVLAGIAANYIYDRFIHRNSK